MKTTYKIILRVLAVLAVAYAILMIPTFRHRSEQDRVVQGFRSLPRERVDSAILSFVAAQKAHSRSISKTVSLPELVASGSLRAEEAAPFGGVDVSFTISVDKNDPQEILARLRLSSGLVLVELADGSIQQVAWSALDRQDSR